MISLVVIMSAAHQILVGAVTSLLVAGAVGYGSASFFAGGIERQVQVNTDELKDRKALVDKSANVESRIATLESEMRSVSKRIDLFEAIVVDNQKESQKIAYQILNEVAAMRKDTAVNSTRIGAIEVDISEIKEKVK